MSSNIETNFLYKMNSEFIFIGQQLYRIMTDENNENFAVPIPQEEMHIYSHITPKNTLSVEKEQVLPVESGTIISGNDTQFINNPDHQDDINWEAMIESNDSEIPSKNFFGDLIDNKDNSNGNVEGNSETRTKEDTSQQLILSNHNQDHLLHESTVQQSCPVLGHNNVDDAGGLKYKETEKPKNEIKPRSRGRPKKNSLKLRTIINKPSGQRKKIHVKAVSPSLPLSDNKPKKSVTNINTGENKETEMKREVEDMMNVKSKIMDTNDEINYFNCKINKRSQKRNKRGNKLKGKRNNAEIAKEKVENNKNEQRQMFSEEELMEKLDFDDFELLRNIAYDILISEELERK